MKNNPLITYLQLFKFLSEEDKDSISSSFDYRTFKEGDELFHAGAICKEMFFVCNGILKIVISNEKGNNLTYFFVKENKLCTILNSFTNEVPAKENIVAACETAVLVISKTKLDALYSKLPYLKQLIDQITKQTLMDKIQTKSAYLGQDSTTRYQLFMMREPEVAMRVALSDIASYLGITPQSLSRIRKNIR